MNKQKTIQIISPSLKIGGIGRVLTELANHFTTEGYKVFFVSCLAGEHLYHLDERIVFKEPNFKRRHSFINKLLFYPRLIIFIRSSIKSVKPYSILTFGDWFNNIVLIASLGLGVNVFISDRTLPAYKFKFPIPLLKRLLYPKSAGFIAQSKSAELHKKRQFGQSFNTKVINNPVKEITIIDQGKERIILYAGRFAWEKAPDRLIRAFAGVSNKNGWRLFMAGTGPLLDDMKRLAVELDLSEVVVFLGQVNGMEELYSKASIFVLPSVLEGFPNALCEAMAAGLPVICFDGFPSDEIITNGFDGLILKDGDIASLTLHIERLMNNECERIKLGQNATSIKKRLSIENIGKQYLNFMFDMSI